MINSQITKAHNYLINNYISYNLLNSSLIYWLYNYISLCITLSVRWNIIIISKLVEISEAIRLILVFIKLNLINLMPKFSILKKHIFVSKNHFSSKSLLLNNRYCLVFSRNMSTNINTNSLDNSNIHKSTD